MSELEPTGQSAPVSASVVEPTAPATPQVPTEPTPTVPASPAGKSQDQLLSELEEARQLISQANERAARAEHEAVYTRNLVEQFSKGKPTAGATEPQVPMPTNEEWNFSPGEAAQKLIMSIRAQDKAEREQKDREQYVERARAFFEQGKQKVLTPQNKITQGIENEVQSEIQNGIIKGVIDPEAATDPDLWAMTAMAYRFKVRGERNFDKYFGSPTPTGMAPAHTETPTAGNPPQATVPLSEEEKWMAKQWGITEEAYLEQKKQSMAEQARLAR